MLSIVYTQIDFCSPKNGTFGTLQMLLSQGVDVIFGPICSTGIGNANAHHVGNTVRTSIINIWNILINI